MPDSDPKGQIFLSTPYTHDRFFFLHTFQFWMLTFNYEVTSIADVHHIVMILPWHLYPYVQWRQP